MDEDRILTTEEMIADVRMQARFVREKTALPERIAALFDEIASELVLWKIASDKDKING